MSVEQLQAIADIVAALGFPIIVGIVSLGVVWKFTDIFVARESSETRMAEVSHSELVKLRESERKIIEDRLELEHKYTVCEKERVRLEETVKSLEKEQQRTVDEYLEDTQTFDHSLDVKDREILRLTGLLGDKEEIIAKRDATIQKLIETWFDITGDSVGQKEGDEHIETDGES